MIYFKLDVLWVGKEWLWEAAHCKNMIWLQGQFCWSCMMLHLGFTVEKHTVIYGKNGKTPPFPTMSQFMIWFLKNESSAYHKCNVGIATWPFLCCYCLLSFKTLSMSQIKIQTTSIQFLIDNWGFDARLGCLWSLLKLSFSTGVYIYK
jgi:hypothetical protein